MTKRWIVRVALMALSVAIYGPSSKPGCDKPRRTE